MHPPPQTKTKKKKAKSVVGKEVAEENPNFQVNKPHVKKRKTNREKLPHNLKAYSVSSVGKLRKHEQRRYVVEEKKLKVPKKTVEPKSIPRIVSVVGPRGSGKTTLITSLVRHFSHQTLTKIKGPITTVTSKHFRMTFMECPADDINALIDLSKISDIVLLTVDASFGFEMVTFEFLNLLQAHGFPKVMGVLTKLDTIKKASKARKLKKQFKKRFAVEIFKGSKLFYFSGIKYGRYLKNEVLNLARYLSIMKIKPLTFKTNHPFVFCDRVEDLTPRETLRSNQMADRRVAFYGYVHGNYLKPSSKICVPGLGEFFSKEISIMGDPCPLSESSSRKLGARERMVYSPMSDVGGVLIDRDAVYVHIPKAELQFEIGAEKQEEASDEGVEMIRNLQKIDKTIDTSIGSRSISIFGGDTPVAPVDEDISDSEQDISLPSDSESVDLDQVKESAVGLGLQGTDRVTTQMLVDLVYGGGYNGSPSDMDCYVTHRDPGEVREYLDRIDDFCVPSDESSEESSSEEPTTDGSSSSSSSSSSSESEESESEGGPETLKARNKKKHEIREKLRKDPSLFDNKELQKELTHYEKVKLEMDRQVERNAQEFADMDPETRYEYEGFPPGSYLRIVFDSVPAEFIQNFDARYPVVLGSIAKNEEGVGILTARFKKHRWFPRLLKTNDPLVFSVGWRRFQSLPVFYTEDHNSDRKRMLKATNEHMHCYAAFTGPFAPQGTGIVAIQNYVGKDMNFRISGTGVVLSSGKGVNIVKKLKLVGYPKKVFKNTAFIGDMFVSDIEAQRFIGTKIRTTSGIRGIIKKTVGEDGTIRATFEDKIQMSDIVFVRTWVPIEVMNYYNPVPSHLEPRGSLSGKDIESTWRPMRSLWQLRNDLGVEKEFREDSIYDRSGKRKEFHFSKLKIPTSLAKRLPANLKKRKKSAPKRKKPEDKLREVPVSLSELEERRLSGELTVLAKAKREKAKEQKRKRAAMVKGQKEREMKEIREKRKRRRKEYFQRHKTKAKQ